MNKINFTILVVLICLLLMECNSDGTGTARTYHVSVAGSDTNNGTEAMPLKTISSAAAKAQPGDTITVHEGIYRERINPPRGGTSDDKRIVYQAAPGETVVIKGSERVTGWEKVEDDSWMVKMPNRFFGNFNPFNDVIKGDWYEAKQPYHTGAVYLKGHWLKEAAVKSMVVKSEDSMVGEGTAPEFLNLQGFFLQNDNTNPIPASGYVGASREIGVVDLEEGRDYIGKLRDGDWLAYDVDFGPGSSYISVLTASPEGMSVVEIRENKPHGELLGKCETGITAEWTHFQPYRTRIKELSGKHRIVLVFKSKPLEQSSDDSDEGYWFSKADEDTTRIWAQFRNVDPNQAHVEINVRQTVFYPEKPGVNYITVQGFTLEQAATPWATPTAEQIGLIGTHWSKGWVIANNTIRYSACSGVTLGKHGDEFDNTYNYDRTIRMGLEHGWNRETIGSHLVKNNHILHCGQTGIVGSLGAAFSTITGNEIHEIRQHHQYGGCETAGIKLHGAVDVIISNNHVYRCEHWGGIWLDWMAQGARVSGNLLHDNSQDLMFEVNHGPHLVDNNLLMSEKYVTEASGGGAFVHNLWFDAVSIWPEMEQRLTPYFKQHSTEIIDKSNVNQHDDRYLNNLFVGPKGNSAYDEHKFAITAAGNVFLSGARPSKQDKDALVAADFDPGIKLFEKDDGWWLEMNIDPSWQAKHKRSLVTSELLGKAKVPDAPFEHSDGTPYRIDTDYFGEKRNVDDPAAGPFRAEHSGEVSLKVWPRKRVTER